MTRKKKQTGQDEGQLSWGDLVLDLEHRKLFLAGERVKLTPKELELLEYLLRRPHQVISREELMRKIWQVAFKDENQILDRNISRLRAKLHGRGKNLVQTMRGEGYALGVSEVM